MSTATASQQSEPILGNTSHEFVTGLRQGHAVAQHSQAAITGVYRFAKMICLFVYLLIRLVLTGFVGWSVFYIRRRIGLISSIMFLLSGYLTLAFAGPKAGSMHAGFVILAWGLFMLAFGVIQIIWGVYRLFAPPPMHEHIHRFSAGVSNTWTVFLWDLLPERARTSSFVHARDLLALILISLGLWILDRVILAENPKQSTALYIIPLMSAAALVLLATMDLVVAAYQGQVFRDQLLDQQDEAERMNSIQGSMHEREVEGFVQSI